MKSLPFNVSFEFFPPKSFEAMQQLLVTAESLNEYNPDFFSVTFGAGGSTRQRTIESVTHLQQKINTPIAPHIACIGYDRAELVGIIEQYIRMNVKRIVVLRGDLPSGMVSAGDFELAYEFVKCIRVISGNHFHITVAAYPECHPLARTMTADIENLKMKFDAGANMAITQYFYSPDAYFYFLDDCAKAGINIPIVPGIMPIINYERLIRFSTLCGADVPRWLKRRLECYIDDPASTKSFGIDFMHHFCERLLSGGAPGLHFYTLNHDSEVRSILDKLSGLALKGVKVTKKDMAKS
jgi:methylenetetrahydrofolate reductase (NADPH)